eukprot:Nitzschia sp. Nitz4//scaffold35_size145790//12592//13121//NITZ4_003006-RA/size145790-augustus-gene-0.109-mRNA-1//1//CDS//3329549052//1926//frame0
MGAPLETETSLANESIPQHPATFTFIEKLKYDHLEDQLFASKRKAEEVEGPATKKLKKRKTLTFQETVQVVPIPMRTEYSIGERSSMWSSASELQANAARNEFEFAFEGWNWRNVLDDVNLFYTLGNSELIHPCHLYVFLR